MKNLKKWIVILMIAILPTYPVTVQADLWGGDIPLLIKIVANTLEQLIQLRKILGTSEDTLNYIRDINSGIREALRMAQTMNTNISPGILSNIDSVERLLDVVQHLYGTIPNTPEAQMQKTMDQSIAESIVMHNEAFKYAQNIDNEAERIKEYASVVSPLGAERLTAQSIGVLIHVMNQILRTNAAILKMNSENLALQNKKEKLNSEHFKIQYEGVSRAFGDLHSKYNLPSLSHEGD